MTTSSPDAGHLFAVLDATWPAIEHVSVPGWSVRRGAGGGKRVSAGTATVTNPSIAELDKAQASLDQASLVMVRSGESALDAALAKAKFQIVDRTRIYLAPTDRLATPPPRLSGFLVDWPCLSLQREIWAEGDIGPDRIAVMDRVTGPKIGLLGRAKDTPCGTGFVGAYDGVAMIHALEVRANARRQGLGRHMMQAAALWAQDLGIPWLALLVTEANAPANALYRSLGMEAVGHYHYRIRQAEAL